MPPKKLFHVDMMVQETVLHDLLSLAAGKSFEVNVRPVKHGGMSEETGALKSAPTGPQFVAAYIATHPKFTTRELAAAAREVGLNNKNTVYAVVHAMHGNKLLKRTRTGEYAVTARGAKLPLKPNGNVARRGTSRPKPGERNSDYIAVVLKKHDKGEGVHIKQIKAALAEQGTTGSSSISPVLTSMLRKKQIARISEGVYRLANGAA